MSEQILDDLRAFLAKALAAVPVGRARKAEIHEELQAHLFSLYEEELARFGDELAAASSAKRRFGRVEDLTGELQASVGWSQWFRFLIQQKESVMWRWLLLAGCVAVLVGLGFVFPAIAHFNDHNLATREDSVGLIVARLVLGITVTLGGLGSCVWGTMLKLRPTCS